MTRLSDQIDNENDFGLGHWSETDTQYSDARHMMHAPLTTSEPLTSRLPLHGYERLGIHRRHYERTSTPVNPPSNGGSRALSGVRRRSLTEIRDKSELFLDNS